MVEVFSLGEGILSIIPVSWGARALVVAWVAILGGYALYTLIQLAHSISKNPFQAIFRCLVIALIIITILYVGHACLHPISRAIRGVFTLMDTIEVAGQQVRWAGIGFSALLLLTVFLAYQLLRYLNASSGPVRRNSVSSGGNRGTENVGADSNVNVAARQELIRLIREALQEDGSMLVAKAEVETEQNTPSVSTEIQQLVREEVAKPLQSLIVAVSHLSAVVNTLPNAFLVTEGLDHVEQQLGEIARDVQCSVANTYLRPRLRTESSISGVESITEQPRVVPPQQREVHPTILGRNRFAALSADDDQDSDSEGEETGNIQNMSFVKTATVNKNKPTATKRTRFQSSSSSSSPMPAALQEELSKGTEAEALAKLRE